MTVEHAELARIAFAHSPHPLPWGELRTWGPHPLDDDRGRHDGTVLPGAGEPASTAPGCGAAGRRNDLRPPDSTRTRDRLRDRLSRLKSHQQLQSCSTDGNELLLRIQTPSHNTQNIGENLKQHTRTFSFKLVERSVVNTQRGQ